MLQKGGWATYPSVYHSVPTAEDLIAKIPAGLRLGPILKRDFPPIAC
jgi:hypothetical protein